MEPHFEHSPFAFLLLLRLVRLDAFLARPRLMQFDAARFKMSLNLVGYEIDSIQIEFRYLGNYIFAPARYRCFCQDVTQHGMNGDNHRLGIAPPGFVWNSTNVATPQIHF